MHEPSFFKTRLYLTGIVTIAIWSLLAWYHYHGGVPSHHILARKDLPEISNWWGGLLLPVLTWFLSYCVQRRLIRNNARTSEPTQIPKAVIYGFAGALVFGILLSAFFTFGFSEPPFYMLIGALLLALFFPIYRAECLLGFVLGMTYTFGAVLPTGIGSILAILGAVLFLVVRPLLAFVSSKFVGLVGSNK